MGPLSRHWRLAPAAATLAAAVAVLVTSNSGVVMGAPPRAPQPATPSSAASANTSVAAAVARSWSWSWATPTPSPAGCAFSATACPDTATAIDKTYASHVCMANGGVDNAALQRALDDLGALTASGCCDAARGETLLEALLALVKRDTCGTPEEYQYGWVFPVWSPTHVRQTAAVVRAAPAVGGGGGGGSTTITTPAGVTADGGDGGTPTTLDGDAGAGAPAGTAAAAAAAGAGAGVTPAGRVTISLAPYDKCCTGWDHYEGICCDAYCHIVGALFPTLYTYEECCGVPLPSPTRANPTLKAQRDLSNECAAA